MKNTMTAGIAAALLSTGMLFYSCRKIEQASTIQNPQSEAHVSLQNESKREIGETLYASGDIILGNTLTNPYTITNMQAARQSLMQRSIPNTSVLSVRATHYYVKFKPQNEDQYELLAANPNLKLYDYPLDVKIVQSGNRYHDPSLPIEIPTYQYACVKIGFSFNSQVPYEIISQLYIPEEDTSIPATSDNEKLVDLLLTQAYVQTQNYDDTIHSSRGKYRPAGKIQVFDTRLNSLIGLEGVEVRARRWFTTYYGYGDFYGNYSVNGTFKNPCNYSLWMATNNFSVREHLLGLTFHIDGPKTSNNWNYDISSGYDRFEAHIFRGAFRYHYKNIDGLQRPLRPNHNRTKYVGKDQAKDWSGVNYIVFPILKIARYFSDTEYASDEVFSTTIHETAHTSHVIKMNTGIIQYGQVTSELQESWAIGIEWWLTKLEYKNTRGIPNYGDWNYSTPVQYPHQYAYQYWNRRIAPTYTTLYIDLIDNFNQNGVLFGWKSGSVNDNVKNYTLAYIEQNILKHAYGLTSLAQKLKQFKPIGVTDQDIDILLSNY